jgi:trk system potassium uptake protein TrkH
VRLFAVLFSLSSVVAYFLVTSGSYGGSKAVRVALFEMATALTTTGFSTVGYGGWRPVGYMLLVSLMIVGGGSCSTAGGVKQFRIYLLYKSVVWEVKSIFLPRRAIQKRAIFHGEAPLFISDKDISTTGSFLFIYLALLSAGSMVLAAHGFSVKDSFFEMASALGTVGLSLGISSAEAPPAVLWTLTSGMLLGRLEIFVVFAALGKLFRR